MNTSESRVRWIIGTLITLLAAGGGIVALLTYFNPPHQPPSMSISNGTTITPPSNRPIDTCVQGYVWREARPSDHVCVTPETRAQAQDDNSQAQSRIDPNGAYGPYSCIQGYVWRNAFPNDYVCVTPETRAQAQDDNSQAQSRIAP